MNTTAAKERRVGRPRIGDPIEVIVTPAQREWLESQDEAMSVIVRQAISQMMAREGSNGGER